MKKQCSTVLFLLIILLFLVFLPISMVFFNINKNIIILTISFGGIFFLFWCLFCFLIPQKDLKKYIDLRNKLTKHRLEAKQGKNNK